MSLLLRLLIKSNLVWLLEKDLTLVKMEKLLKNQKKIAVHRVAMHFKTN